MYRWSRRGAGGDDTDLSLVLCGLVRNRVYRGRGTVVDLVDSGTPVFRDP